MKMGKLGEIEEDGLSSVKVGRQVLKPATHNQAKRLLPAAIGVSC